MAKMDAAKHRKTVFEKVGVQFQSSAYQDAIRVDEACEEYTSLYKHQADYPAILRQFGLWELTKSMNVATSLLYFPMLLFSGATIPYELFPEGMQLVAGYMPLGIGIRLMKTVVMGLPLGGMWREIAGNIRESYIDGVWNKETESEWLSEIQIPVRVTEK